MTAGGENLSKSGLFTKGTQRKITAGGENLSKFELFTKGTQRKITAGVDFRNFDFLLWKH